MKCHDNKELCQSERGCLQLLKFCQCCGEKFDVFGKVWRMRFLGEKDNVFYFNCKCNSTLCLTETDYPFLTKKLQYLIVWPFPAVK